MSLRIVIKVVLFSVLSFEVVNVALVVIDRFELLLKQLESKVSKKNALNKSEDASYKRIGVAGLVHVILGPSR